MCPGRGAGLQDDQNRIDERFAVRAGFPQFALNGLRVPPVGLIAIAQAGGVPDGHAVEIIAGNLLGFGGGSLAHARLVRTEESVDGGRFAAARGSGNHDVESLFAQPAQLVQQGATGGFIQVEGFDVIGDIAERRGRCRCVHGVSPCMLTGCANKSRKAGAARAHRLSGRLRPRDGTAEAERHDVPPCSHTVEAANWYCAEWR